MTLPHAPACDENREPILAVLAQEFAEPGLVLEIGSGTGEHAVWFSPRLPHLTWQPSDRAERLAGIEQWLKAEPASNLRPVLELDVATTPWPVAHTDYLFSANTAHIMPWPVVEQLFVGVAEVLRGGGRFCLYGPFRRGEAIAQSNVEFDHYLKQRDPAQGVRDLDDLERLAQAVGLRLVASHTMPRDNLTLVWTKI